MPNLTSTVTQTLVIPPRMRGIFPNTVRITIPLVAGVPKEVPEYVARYYAQMKPSVFSTDISTAKFGSEILVVGTTPVRAPVFPEADYILFMHENPTATVWIGDSEVSAANGYAAFKNLDTPYKVAVGADLNEVYLISDTADVNVKVSWGMRKEVIALVK